MSYKIHIYNTKYTEENEKEVVNIQKVVKFIKPRRKFLRHIKPSQQYSVCVKGFLKNPRVVHVFEMTPIKI